MLRVRRIGGLGTLLFGAVPSAGTLEALRINHYACAPAGASATAILAATTLPTTGTLTVTANITNPDFPRVLSITGNASGITGNVLVNGLDFSGATIQDTIALSGTATVVGAKAFTSVSSVVFPQRTHASDTCSVGTSVDIGLPQVIEATDVLFVHNVSGSTDAGTVTQSATLSGNFYAVAGTLNGTNILDLYYLA